MRLLKNVAGIDALIERAGIDAHQIKFDLTVPLMSLAGIFNTTLERIPADVPYIRAADVQVSAWRRRLRQDTFKVGIVWAGNPTTRFKTGELSGCEPVNLKWAGKPSSKIAGRRSDRLEHFAALAGIKGVQLYGLQKGAAAAQAAELSNSIAVINLGEEFKDFADTAGVIANLDLIVSVDTSVAHLAGAMGKPVWVLIPFVSDWRWMLERDDSPWYPTMRLFRQKKNGLWDEVFERIATELAALIGE